MLNTIYKVINQGFLSFHCIIFIFMILILIGTKPRKHGVLTLILGLIPYFAVPATYVFIKNPQLFQGERVLYYFWVNPYTRIGWYNFSYLIFFFYAILLIHASFDISFKRALFIGVSAYTAQNLLYNCEVIFQICFSPQGKDTWQWELFSSIYHLAFYAGFYFICGRNYKEERIVDFNSVWLMVFFLSSIVIINVYSQWLFDQNYQGNYEYVNLPIATYSGFCALLLLAVQFGFFQQSKEKREKEIMETVIEKSNDQQKVSNDNVDVINRKVHDLKHQVRILKGMMGEEEQKKALEEIEYSLNIYDSDIKTGNKVLDIVLMEKGLQCKSKHIDFSVMADGKKLDQIAKSDLFILFGNMLDNAIEASMKEKEENRIIVLSVKESKGFLQIESENFCSGILEFKNGLPMSTKTNDGSHGFGSKSMQFIAEKYHGTMKASLENQKYRISILIPLQTGAEKSAG